jgi:hypothetical protein
LLTKQATNDTLSTNESNKENHSQQGAHQGQQREFHKNTNRDTKEGEANKSLPLGRTPFQGSASFAAYTSQSPKNCIQMLYFDTEYAGNIK